MQFPALSIGQGFDLGRTIATAEAIKSARTRNALLERQIAREDELKGLRQAIFAQPAAGAAPTNALAADAMPDVDPAPVSLNPAAAGQGFPKIDNAMLMNYMAVDPAGGANIFNVVSKMNEQQREQLKRANDLTGRLLIGVQGAPPEQREAAYQQALAAARQNGIPVDNVPAQYDPAWVRSKIAEAMTIEQHLAQAKPPAGFDRTEGGLAPTTGGPADPKYLKEKATAERKGADAPSRIREAEILVERGVFPSFDAAYNATRTRVQMDPTSIRVRGLAWVAQQKDRFGNPKYTKPEQQAAALQAFQKWAKGDDAGALAALKSLEPKKDPEAEPGLVTSLWRSLMGGGETPAPAAQPGGAFDPESAGYDNARARAAGMTPAGPEAGENAGHMGSVAETTPEEQKKYGVPPNSYVVLKGRTHPTWNLAVQGEEARGFKIVKKGDRYFSVPAGGKKPAAAQGQPATPTSQADFDALPSGALYVNPADGKTYKKK